jgi:peptide/nickel transport system permease protein
MSLTTRSGNSTSPQSADSETLGAAFARRRSQHPLIFFVVRRLIALVFLCLGVTFMAFVLTHLVPADVAAANLGVHQGSNPVAVRLYNERYGLDKPLPIQYEVYLAHLIHGDLGLSEQSGRPVSDDLAAAIPATAELAITSMILALPIGITLGVVAALRRNRLTDQVLRVLSLAGMSTPQFWLALVALYFFFYLLGWVPGSGRLDAAYPAPPHVTGLFTIDSLLAGQLDLFANALHHLVLPASVLAAFNIGLFTRFTRSAVLEVLKNDYVRTARAKGLPDWIIIPRHVLRAAGPPVLTIVGLAFGNVMTGTVLVENIFSWPGIGQYSYASATTLDLPSIVGVMLFFAVVYIVLNLSVDILHGVIDPRLQVT